MESTNVVIKANDLDSGCVIRVGGMLQSLQVQIQLIFTTKIVSVFSMTLLNLQTLDGMTRSFCEDLIKEVTYRGSDELAMGLSE